VARQLGTLCSDYFNLASATKIAISDNPFAADQLRWNKDKSMRLILAIFLPWLQFFTIGRPFAGIICLILQLTLVGWIPACIWSVYALSQYKTDQKIKDSLADK
jgi:uncharacterized membrane protein YqaE (UPF0057 family)|tara:strand:- start:441 stop:752 length:312 start_codon:yes stop_codon:yes gene_type:complete